MRNLLRGDVANVVFLAMVLVGVFNAGNVSAAEPFIIAASPSLAAPLEALGREFEVTHPDVKVRLYFDSGLDLRRTIAGMENNPRGQFFIGTGPIHLVAPGGDELITRLEQKYYVLPGTSRPYAAEPLVLVVPATLVDAPASFEAVGQDEKIRVAIAEPILTRLGQQTKELLEILGIWDRVKGRLDMGTDARGVLDHLLHGQADVGILYGPDAVKESERVRIVAWSDARTVKPTVHSMAMERYCPNRGLCEEFLSFIQTPEAQDLLKRLGYASPVNGKGTSKNK